MISKKLLLIIGGSTVVATAGVGLGVGLGLSQNQHSQEDKSKIDETTKSISKEDKKTQITTKETKLVKKTEETVQEKLKRLSKFWNKGLIFNVEPLQTEEDITYFLNNLPENLWNNEDSLVKRSQSRNLSLIKLANFYLNSQLTINPNYFANDVDGKKWNEFFKKLQAALIKKYPNNKSDFDWVYENVIVANNFKESNNIEDSSNDESKNQAKTNDSTTELTQSQFNYTEEDKKQAQQKLNSFKSVFNNFGYFATTNLFNTEGQINYFLDNLPDDLNIEPPQGFRIPGFFSLINIYFNSLLASNPNYFANDVENKKWNEAVLKLKNALIKKYPKNANFISSVLDIFFRDANSNINEQKKTSDSIAKVSKNYTEEDKKQVQQKLNPFKTVWDKFIFFNNPNLLTTQGQINYFIDNFPKEIGTKNSWFGLGSNIPLINLFSFALNSQLKIDPNYFASDANGKKWNEFIKKLETAITKQFPKAGGLEREFGELNIYE